MKRRFFVAVAFAFAGLLALAPSASAHAQLSSTEPSAGALLDNPPSSVVLRFSENVQVKEGGVKVFDSSGKRVDDGKLQKPDGGTVVVPLKSIGNGGYVVAYRVVSADGHPVSGGFTWRVGQSSTAVDPSTVQNLLAASKGDKTVGVTYGFVRFIVFASLLFLVGAGAFIAALWPAGADHTRVRKLMWWAWGALFVGSLAGLCLHAADVGALGIGGALEPSVVNGSLDSTFGKVWLGRVLLLVPIAVLLQLLDQAKRAWWRVAGALAAAGLLITPVLTGHADTGRWVGLAKVADFAHLTGGAVWLGGLAVLLLVVLRSDVDDARPITERFSPVAFTAVAIVVLSGVFNAIRQVPTLDGLETNYGRLLVVKVVLVLGLIGVASLTRSALQGRLNMSGFDVELEPVPVGPGAAARGEGNEIGILRRLVGAEVAVAIIVLAVTALLVDANPGFGATSAAVPSDQTHVVDSVLINVVVVPGAVGPTDVHLYVDNPAGGLKPVVGVTGTFSLPSAGITGINVPFVDAGANHWIADNVDITIGGKWELTIDVLVTDIDKKTTTFTVPIGGSS